MKRVLTILLIFGLLVGAMAMPADARKKKKKKPKRIERVVKVAYDHPGIGVSLGPAGAAGYPSSFPESGEIGTSLKETFFKIEVEDASGQPVAGFISQGDLDGNGVNDDGYGTFCGKHEEAQPLEAPGQPIIGIYAYSGFCEDGTPAFMTTGTIKITFSNMP